jgi:hypothetical protein
MELVKANFRATNLKENAWFTQTHRDNCTYPFWLLREKIREYGIDLNTPDINGCNKIAFEIHIDYQPVNLNNSIPIFLFLWETSQVYAPNAYHNAFQKFHRVFSWDDNLVKIYNYCKFNLPIHFEPNEIVLGWNERDKLCCAISGNKNIRKNDNRELYSKRVETYRWFELNAPSDFDLFGTGWDGPMAIPGLIGKIITSPLQHIYKALGIVSFPSYRGVVETKRTILTKYRFSICYENISDLPGYITEKIFDSFFSGCVPVYWGASNVTEYIPKECFIDRRNFTTNENLYEYISSITETEYSSYQNSIKEFLTTESAKAFSAEIFVSKVIKTILPEIEKIR